MQTRVHVTGGQMAAGVAVTRRQGIVGRESVQWIRKHHEGRDKSAYAVEGLSKVRWAVVKSGKEWWRRMVKECPDKQRDLVKM